MNSGPEFKQDKKGVTSQQESSSASLGSEEDTAKADDQLSVC